MLSPLRSFCMSSARLTAISTHALNAFDCCPLSMWLKLHRIASSICFCSDHDEIHADKARTVCWLSM